VNILLKKNKKKEGEYFFLKKGKKKDGQYSFKKRKGKKKEGGGEYLNSFSVNPILFSPGSSGGSNNPPYCSHLTKHPLFLLLFR